MDFRSRNRFYIDRKSNGIPSKLKDVLCQCLCLQIVSLIMIVSAHTMSPTHSSTVSAVSSLPLVAFHPRLSELFPGSFQGTEGSKVEGFELKKSLVVMTPGLATPPDHVTGNPSLTADISDFCNFKKYSQDHKSSKVRSYLEMLFLKDKTKHKQKRKSGFKIVQPVAQDGEVCQSEGLTVVGVSQAIQLGEYLSEAYEGKLRSLNSVTVHESLAETVGDIVLYQSLNALLHGLLNEKQFLSTDVAKLSSDFTVGKPAKDKHLHFKDELHYFVEKAYKTESLLFKEHMFTHSDPEVKLPAKDVLTYLLNVIHSMDVNAANLLGNLDLSIWALDNLFNKSDSHSIYLASSPVFQVYANHQTYYLRQRMAELLSFEDQARGDVKRDFRALAVDDLTMLSLLVSLNLTVDRHLQPASRLVVEVLSRSPSVDSAGGKKAIEKVSSHNSILKGSQAKATLSPAFESRSLTTLPSREYVRVLLNGNSVTSSIPDCSTDVLAGLELCSADTFVNILSFLFDASERNVEL